MIPESSPHCFPTWRRGQVDTYSFTNPIGHFASPGHCWALGKTADRSTVDLPRLDMSGILGAGRFVGWAGQAGNSDRAGGQEGRHSFLGQHLPSVHQLRPSRLLPDSPHGEGAPRRQTPNRSARAFTLPKSTPCPRVARCIYRQSRPAGLTLYTRTSPPQPPPPTHRRHERV